MICKKTCISRNVDFWAPHNVPFWRLGFECMVSPRFSLIPQHIDGWDDDLPKDLHHLIHKFNVQQYHRNQNDNNVDIIQ